MKSVGGITAEKNGVLPPLVLGNGRAKPLAFFVRGIDSYDEFNGLVARPKPAQGMYKKDQGWVADEKSPAYRDQLAEFSRLRGAWTVIKSLEPSNIEWTAVDPKVPATWKGVHDKLRAKLSENEYILLLDKIEEANCLSAEKLQENLETFFREREEAARKRFFPSYRSGKYAIWRACVRVGILPPGFPPGEKQRWEDCGRETQMNILNFDEVTNHDDWNEKQTLALLSKLKG